MKKYPTIEGVLYDIKVSVVTQRYLNRIAANKNEIVQGAYVPEENIIYLSKSLDSENKLHTLLHELYHAFDFHCERMETEAKADSFAALLIRIFNPTNIEEILKK